MIEKMQKKARIIKKLENAVNNVVGQKVFFLCCVGKLLILSRNLNFSYHCLQLEMVSEGYYVIFIIFFSSYFSFHYIVLNSVSNVKEIFRFFFILNWSNRTSYTALK